MELKDLLPIPDLAGCKKLLCIQPHPDDNEIGAGATIAKLAQSGCQITYLTVTDGALGTLDPAVDPGELALTRKQEAEESARLLGAASTLYLDYPDGSYPSEQELASRILAVIREEQPEMVMTVDPFLPYEAHPDHRRVGMAVTAACLFSAFPHYRSYGDPNPSKQWEVKGIAFYNTAYPNTFIDVDATWDLKIRSIAVHRSQFDEETLAKYKGYFEFKAAQYAEGRGFARAEAFKVLTPLHLHVNVDTIHA